MKSSKKGEQRMKEWIKSILIEMLARAVFAAIITAFLYLAVFHLIKNPDLSSMVVIYFLVLIYLRI